MTHPRDCPHGRKWGKCPECDLVESEDENERMRSEYANLIAAAKAVCDRWDSPNWKDAGPTADYIARLRRAVEAHNAQVKAASVSESCLEPLVGQQEK